MFPVTRFRCVLVASTLVACLLAAGSSVRGALVAQWPLDEGTGASSVADSSGNHYDGAMKNFEGDEWVTAPGDLPPVPSGTTAALRFDGTAAGNQEYIVADGSVSGSSSYQGVTGSAVRSVSAWIKTPAAGDVNRTILSWGTDAAGQKWIFRVQDSNGTDGAIRVEVNGGFVVGQTAVTDDQWHHVVALLPAGKTNVQDILLFVDGVYDAYSARQSTTINTAGGTDVRIGVGHSNHYFQGQMDEVRIYDHDLTPGEVRQLAGVTTSDPYYQAVQTSAPIAYWRLGESAGVAALNEGSLGNQINGTYSGGPTLGQPSLVPTISNTAVRFDGTDDQVNIPSHDDINTGSSYSQKTIETWFSTEAFSGDAPDPDRRVIFDEGGGTNGLNQYVQLDTTTGTYYFRAGAWTGTGLHFPTGVAIDPDQAYHAVSAYDAPNDTFIVYVNGAPVSGKVATGIADILVHTGANAIGAVQQDTHFDNGSVSGNGYHFQGTIDEVALYNSVLDLKAVQTHYVAATGNRLGLARGVTLGAALNYDAGLDGDGNATWEDTIGARDNNATVHYFDWNLGSPGAVPRVAVSSVMLSKLSHAYVFDGSDTASTNSLNDVAGDPSRFSASFEMVFKPDDFTGQEVLFETGGAGDGLSITLDGSTLWLNVKNGNENARASFDLARLGPGAQNDFLHVVGVADLDNDQALLYVNGVLRVTQAGTGDLADWSGTDDAGLGSINGAINFGSPSPFAGQIGLFRFYPGILTAEEVMANYGALLPEPSTLVLLGLGVVGLGLLLPRRSRRRREGNA